MEKQILHVDVNNAFLSWSAVEMIKNGYNIDIREIPAIIGGDENQRHGVVLAKSMPAKILGIKTGEPIYFARKKCPNLKVYPSNFNVYKKYSDNLYNLLLEYTDKIERFSIDECFMDMTNFLKKDDKLLDIAIDINNKVREKLGFTVNIGVANNKLLAKMASDFQKPNKVHTLYKQEIPNKMWTLPVSELFMVGKKTIPKLEKMHIKKIGDLAKTDKEALIRKFGKHGKIMWEYANGIDNSEVEYKKTKPKGVGNSITLSYDVTNLEELNEILLALTEQVSYRLRKYKMTAKVINVQIKNKYFEVYSHQRKLEIETNSTKKIYMVAKELLKELHRNEPIRLIGIRVDNLSSNEEKQISFFDTESEKRQEKLDETIDKLKEKYGYNKITRAGKMRVNDIINLKD